MGFMDSFFGFRISTQRVELPEIFPLSVAFADFVRTDIINIYSKILTDCLDRTQGIQEDIFPLLWDNCLQSESTDGLVTLLAKAMTDKTDLFLVYDPAIQILRLATADEERQIREDYKTQGTSDVGTYVSFKNYKRTDMVRIYSSMEYCVVASLNKTMNLSKAIQFKMGDMRSSVSLTDKDDVVEQAKTVAISLANGRDVMIDSNDSIETSTPQIDPIKQSIEFLDSKRSFYLGMPLSYINGEQTAGIGSTGEADTRAVERGLRQYYISILKPVIEDLFEIKTSFKSNDFRQISSALEALKTFELVGEDMISIDNKRIIISRMFDVEDTTQGKPRTEIPLTTASVRG
jgi:hypothetical protein